MNELVVFGAGGHAREIIALVRDWNAARPPEAQWRLVGVLTDRPEWSLPPELGIPRLGAIEWLKAHPGCSVVVAVGDPVARQDIVARIRGACGNAFATLVHPRAWLAERVTLGEGTQILAGTLVNADVTIGMHAIVNMGCKVSHDALVDDFATLGPGVTLCGGATAGRGCELGASAVVLPRVGIGPGARLGAGAVAARAVAAGITAVGIPAHPLVTAS